MSLSSVPIVVNTRLGGLFVYGDGSDGNVTLTVNTTLTRDMYYNNLTINSGVNLDPSGYRIFVQNTLTFVDGTSKISRVANTTAFGTVGGGYNTGNNAATSLGGNSGDQTASQLSPGKDFFYGITNLISTLYVDATTGAVAAVSGGAGGSTGAAGITGAAGTANSGSAGTAGSHAPSANTVGVPGGAGSAGTPGTAGTGGAGGAGGLGGAGGGVIVVLAKTIVGNGVIAVNGIGGLAGSVGSPGTAGTAGTAGTPAPNLTVPGNVVGYNSPAYPVTANNPPSSSLAAYGFGAFTNANNAPNYNVSYGNVAANNAPTYNFVAGNASPTWNAPTYTLSAPPQPRFYNTPNYNRAGGTYASGGNAKYNPVLYPSAGYNTGTPRTQRFNRAGGTPAGTNPTNYNPVSYPIATPGTTATYNPGVFEVAFYGNQQYNAGSSDINFGTAANYNAPTYTLVNYGFGAFTNANNTPNYNFSAGTPSSYSTVPGNATSYNAAQTFPGGAGGAAGTATSGATGGTGSSGFVGGGGVLFVMSTSTLPVGLSTSAAAGTTGQTGTSSAGTIVLINHSVI
jgi:hypothetical protein